MNFFSSMNVIVYELFFVFSQHLKWLIYDLKKCGLLRSFSPPGAKRDAPFALQIVAEENAKIIFLYDIISLFSYILRVRFVSRIWLRLGKSLKVGQTTTLCPAQDYIFQIFRNVMSFFVAGFALDCKQGLCFYFPRFMIRNSHTF